MSGGVIQPFSPEDGRDWDCQCARCGSSATLEECDFCCGNGECEMCHGAGHWWACLSSSEYCIGNPLPGREQTTRGIEWFVVANKGRAGR